MPNGNANGQLKLTVDPTEAQLGLQAMMGNQSLPEVVNQAAQQGIFGPPGQLTADLQMPASPQDQQAAAGGQAGPAFDPDKGAIVANVTGMAPLTGSPQYGSQAQSALPAVPLPAATGSAVPPAQPWAAPAAGPTTAQTLADAAQTLPGSESALGAIPTAPQPTQAGAVQPTRGQRFLHGLGQVLGTALGAVSPGVAMQIPGTPLGKIVAANRAMQQQRLETENLRAQAEAQKAQTEAQTAGPLAQAQIDDYESRGLLTREQADNLRNKTNVVLPNGMILPMTAAEAEKYYQNRETVAGKQQVAQTQVGGKLGAAEIAAGKAQRPVAGLVNGKQATAMYIPNKGWYNPETNEPMPDFQLPPTYAEIAPTLQAPVTFLGPQGEQVGTIQRGGAPVIRPATVAGPPGQPAQPAISAAGAVGHEQGQAAIIGRAGQQLIDDVQANKKLMGNTEAMVRSALLDTPWADPATAGLRAEIQTFAALQPSMHGLRGQAAMDEFGRILGGIPNNPDALIASIQGILKTATAVNPQLSSTRAGGPAPAAGSIETGKGGVQYRFKGGDRNKKENWEKVVSQ